MNVDVSEVLILGVSGITGGGFVSAATALINGRAIARKTEAESDGLAAKLPAEVNSIIVEGAEQAVLTMSTALESAQKRITELESARESDRKQIVELERKVRDLETKFGTAQHALDDARNDAEVLRRELESFARERDQRR